MPRVAIVAPPPVGQRGPMRDSCDSDGTPAPTLRVTDPRRASPRGSPRSRRARTAPSSGGGPAPQGSRGVRRGCRRSSTTAPRSRPSGLAGAAGTRAGPRGGRRAPSAARPCCPRAGRAPSRTRRARSRAGASSAPRRPRRRAAGSPCRARLRDRSSAGDPAADGSPWPAPPRDRLSLDDRGGARRTRRLAGVPTRALWTTLPNWPDVEATWDRAVRAGAEVIYPFTRNFGLDARACGEMRVHSPDCGGFCFRYVACPLVWLAGRLCVPERFAWLESHGAAQRDLHHQ
jgi:hypothetical protein